jgi:CxxC motif-containing protein (DUF1111 family)
MKSDFEISAALLAHPAGNDSSSCKHILILRVWSVMILLLCFGIGTARGQAVDPGPRGGAINAGNAIAGLTADQQRFFQNSLGQFTQVEAVPNPVPGAGGLGPTFNGNSCGMCHVQPAVGGTSPSTSAFPFLGPNPQVALATAMNATNTVPSFVTSDGPVREARFKYVIPSPVSGGPSPRFGFGGDRAVMNPEEAPVADGSVHDLFTIAGRSDAGTCTSYPQENFERGLAENNVSFRIPTPVFGAGLVETISDATILNNLASTAAERAALGIGGIPNRSGNDTSIARFGWKAQNKSLLMFAGEAYNVEMGITNELFGNERGFGGVPPPPSCILNPVPEDATIFQPATSDPMNTPSDIVDFTIFMRFLDQPTPACTGTGCSASIQNGRNLFINLAKCAACHTPSMTTDQSDFAPAALSAVQANLFSDLVTHHMGTNLADGISQGNAGPDQFRTAPLWGLGQRVYFLHDGRTSDLMQAIQAHASQGSEANTVIHIFNGLTTSQKQDLLNFLRSL